MKEIRIGDERCLFIKQFCDDLCSLELLLFFSRHPKARFNRSAVLHAVTFHRFDAGLALKKLVDRKLVVTSIENNITLYALTKSEPEHTLASEMVNIDQKQWQVILKQVLDSQDTVSQ
ncbi:MAG TPA: hypothetical protein VLH15_11775 [Dehalococcoidales bacterium]|nr:hypothetical protein [Dehalococcoidales bacterium]